MTGEWIRCDIDLPPMLDEERSDDVLVAFRDGSCGVVHFDYSSNYWMDCLGDRFFGASVPTHWMLLPDPPADGGE